MHQTRSQCAVTMSRATVNCVQHRIVHLPSCNSVNSVWSLVSIESSDDRHISHTFSTNVNLPSRTPHPSYRQKSSFNQRHLFAGLDVMPQLQHFDHNIATVSMCNPQDARCPLSCHSGSVIMLQQRSHLGDVRPQKAHVRPWLHSIRATCLKGVNGPHSQQ